MTSVIAGSINAPQAHKSNPYRSAPKVRYVQPLLFYQNSALNLTGQFFSGQIPTESFLILYLARMLISAHRSERDALRGVTKVS